jgi:triosephosphate isomerase
MAMTHDAVAAIRQFQVFPYGDKEIGFGDQHLSQHSAGAFTGDFRQGMASG